MVRARSLTLFVAASVTRVEINTIFTREKVFLEIGGGDDNADRQALEVYTTAARR